MISIKNVLMQITTAHQPDSSKIDMLVNQLDDFDHQQSKLGNIKITEDG